MSRTILYRPISVRIATHHTHGTNQFQRISPNRFGKAIRRNSAPVRQGYKVKNIFAKRAFAHTVCDLFHYLFESLLLRMKCVFKRCLVSNETNISNCQPLEDGRGIETQLRHGHLTEYLGKMTRPATGYII